MTKLKVKVKIYVKKEVLLSYFSDFIKTNAENVKIDYLECYVDGTDYYDVNDYKSLEKLNYVNGEFRLEGTLEKKHGMFFPAVFRSGTFEIAIKANASLEDVLEAIELD